MQARLMVAGDEELEGGDEVEKVLPHEACSDLVAAGQCLDFGFVPAPAFLGFLRHHESSAAQLGEVGRVPLAAGGDEGAHVGDGGVIAKYCRDGIDESALAVCAGAVGEDELVLARDAGGG